MASSIPSSLENYPYPLGIKVRDILPFNLSAQNYHTWKPMMLGLIESQELLGFINGEVTAQPKRIRVAADDGSPDGTMEIENPNHWAWERTDSLLRGWILGTVNEEFLQYVVSLETVKDMWNALEAVFTQPQITKSVTDASVTANTQAPVPPNTEAPNTEAAELKNNNLSKYLPLYTALIRDEWKIVSEFLRSEPDAATAIITSDSETALMIAVRHVSGNDFVKNVLLERMPPVDVALADCDGSTALHAAALCGNMEGAKMLVEKYPNLCTIYDNNGLLPIHCAALLGRKDMVHYLLRQNECDSILINGLVLANQYDIALSLIPWMAWAENSMALQLIALKTSAFLSGAHLNWWQRLIYSYAPLKLVDAAHRRSRGDIENPVNSFVSLSDYAKQKLHYILWKLTGTLPQSKGVQEIKWIHNQALKLVKHLCKEVVKLEYSKAKEIFQTSIFIAARVGIPEIIEEIFAAFPDVITAKNDDGQNVFHIAILNRRENIFNIIYQFQDELRYLILATPDLSGKSCLDLVACLELKQRVILRADAPGAALQMQRELQWFKEVEKISLDFYKDFRDPKIGEPKMKFSETHEELMKEGERWMKDTANSCTIVAALIVTIVFAAAITVPGGNSGDNGHPIFTKDKVFLTFGMSDAIALFSSTSSLLMFLSILTSRYAEEDFLEVLPRRLIVGLMTLFISIISMMVAFGATLYLVFGERKSWILGPITAFSCLPGILFMSSQFPLLWDISKSTYGKGVFGKRNDLILL